MKAAPHAAYCLLLQDDTRMAAGLLVKLSAFISAKQASNEAVDVITLFTSNHGTSPVRVRFARSVHSGAVAIVMKSSVLRKFIPYLRSHFESSPVDGLLNSFIEKHQLGFWVFHPNLVQHVGVVSSRAGKTQHIVSGSFNDTQC